MKNIIAIALLCFTTLAQAQEKRVEVGVIAFYNFENLFDTIDSETTNDADFLPTGSYRYTSLVYADKLGRLSKVVSEIGTDVSPDGPSILGVAEVENRLVLEDFVKQPNLAKRNYQIVHFDSPDERGIDVGLLYNPKYFTVTNSKPLLVDLSKAGGDRDKTRDILLVSGVYMGEPLHIMVGHWPSRRGGEAASAPLREYAATVCKMAADSIHAIEKDAQVIVMGDLNDDPTNSSVAKKLMAKGKLNQVFAKDFFNPWYDMYKEGYGTLAYNDSWNLFDQIIISEGLIQKKGFYYLRAKIFNPGYMIQKDGRYQGYPKRSFAGSTYNYGYSDHFPTYITLVRELP
jgi:hypothetical protein